MTQLQTSENWSIPFWKRLIFSRWQSRHLSDRSSIKDYSSVCLIFTNSILITLSISFSYRYSEHVAELFFLQSGGTMMDYPAWKKKPHTPAFLNFMRTYKLEPLSSNLEEAGEILKQVGGETGAVGSIEIWHGFVFSAIIKSIAVSSSKQLINFTARSRN